MLTAGILEKLIQEDLQKAEHLLWEAVAPNASLPAPVREITQKQLKIQKYFWAMDFSLLIGRSLTSPLPTPLLRLAYLSELFQVARGLKSEAIADEAWREHPESTFSDEILNPLPDLTPTARHLLGDCLSSHLFEQLSHFSHTCIVEGFAGAHKAFLESELLRLGARPPQSQGSWTLRCTDHQALLKLKLSKFFGCIASASARICAATEAQLETIHGYAEQIGMAIALLQELPGASDRPFHPICFNESLSERTYFLRLRRSGPTYPLTYALEKAHSEELALLTHGCLQTPCSKRALNDQAAYRCLEKVGAFEATLNAAQQALNLAAGQLNHSSDLPSKHLLLGIIELLQAHLHATRTNEQELMF